MPSADALITPHSPGSPLIFALGSLYLYSEFRWLCRGKWPQAWSSLSQLNAVGFNSWKTQLSSVLEVLWELSKFALLAREIWRETQPVLCVHGHADPCWQENHLLPGGEMLFSSRLPASSESRLGCFWLHSDPSCEQRGLGRTRPGGISPSEGFYEAEGSWSEGLWLPAVRGGGFGKCVSAQCPATMALSQCPELGGTL